MSTLEDFFSHIEDKKVVRVGLPLTNRAQKERIPCVFRTQEPPAFSLLFEIGQLPVQLIDINRKCVVMVDLSGQNISIAADIKAVTAPQTLELKATEVVSHEQLRNYFRVDASTPVTATPLFPSEEQSDQETLLLEGETIDISGSGALCIFSTPLHKGQQVNITLALPTGSKDIIHIKGYVVRCKETEKNTFQTGLHFASLTSEDRDKIMGSCFELQRKHLRMKVKVSNMY